MIKNLVRSLGLSAVLFVLPGVALAYCPPTRPPSLQQQCLDHEERERQQEAARARQREQEVARERQREQEVARDRQREQEAARDRQREQEAARERQQQEAARERQREQEAARAQGSARERQQQEAQEKQRKHQEAERPRITERPGGKLPSLGQGAPLAPPHAPAQQQQQQQLQQPQQRYTQTVAIPGSPQPQPSNNAPTSQTTQARTGTATPTGNTSTIPNASNVSNVSNTANQPTAQQRQTAPATVAPTSQSALLRQQRSAPPSPVIASASPSSLPSPASRTTPVNGVNLATGGNTTPADISGTSSTSGTSTTTSGSGKKAEKKIVWGPLQYEAVAICRKQKRGTYQCFGPLDNEVLGGDTLERGLARQRCAGGTWAAGGPFLHDQQWEAYRCGHALGAGDYDLVKRYNLITAQRTYMCPQYKPSDGRCDTPYDGQDKR